MILPNMAVSSFSFVSGLITTWSAPKCQIQLQKAPGQDLAQNGPFQFFFGQQFNSQVEPAQMPKSKPRFGPK